MELYETPKITAKKIKSFFPKNGRFFKNRFFWLFVLTLFVSSVFGFMGGAISAIYLQKSDFNIFSLLGNSIVATKNQNNGYTPQTTQEQAVVAAVKNVSPSVVSIVITKMTPVYVQEYYNPFKQFEDFFGPGFPNFQVPQLRQNGTQKKEVGGGTGIIISSDGLVLTNKHVVADKAADYTVYTNDGKEYSAKVLARDPIQDLAVIKIQADSVLNKTGNLNLNNFPAVKLGDSDNLQIGQSVIAIGNALGQFRNTVSVGVISGLERSIAASGGGIKENLNDIIQTDAAINPGNSGGPLLNLKGEVIGINTAIATGAQSIGFTIPINQAKRDIKQVEATGKIVYPFLGVRYILVNEQVKTDNKLSVDYGALVKKGDSGEAAVTSGSAAEKAGIKEGDVILELNGEKITADKTLAKLLEKYSPGDKINLKILRNSKTLNAGATLGERND